MVVLFLVVAIDLIGFGIVIPLLPFYGQLYGAAPDTVAYLMATYSLFQLFAAPMWGSLSDRFGRRPVLLWTLAGTVVAYVALAHATTLVQLFLARALGGLMAGNISAAFAYVADITGKRDRAKGMGMVGAAFAIGFVAGPAIGGLLAGADPAAPDFRLPALFSAGLSGVALALAVVRLPESLSAEARRRFRAATAGERWRTLGRTLARPELGLLVAIGFLVTFVFAGMEATFALWSERTFGWGPRENGYLFAFVGLLSAVVQGGLVGPLARRVGERRLIVGGALAFAVGCAALPLANGLAGLLVAMSALVFGFAATLPSLNALIAEHAGENTRGGVMGVARSATIFARVVGPAFAGTLFAGLGKDWPYWTGAAVMAVVALMAGLGIRQGQRERGENAAGADPLP